MKTALGKQKQGTFYTVDSYRILCRGKTKREQKLGVALEQMRKSIYFYFSIYPLMKSNALGEVTIPVVLMFVTGQSSSWLCIILAMTTNAFAYMLDVAKTQWKLL